MFSRFVAPIKAFTQLQQIFSTNSLHFRLIETCSVHYIFKQPKFSEIAQGDVASSEISSSMNRGELGIQKDHVFEFFFHQHICENVITMILTDVKK